MTAILKTFIYMTASTLFVPVLLALALLVICALVYTGQFFRNSLSRRRLEDPGHHLPDRILSGRCKTVLPRPVLAVVRRLDALGPGADPVIVTNVLRDAGHGMWRNLDPLKIMIRLGPGLGLIGTLIPMGTGLAALGQGDLAQLSSELVVAFTTTVVGMAVGLVAYVLFTIQRRWIETDIKNMELAAELLCTKRSGTIAKKAA